MKNLLCAGLLGFTALTALSAPVHAGTFGLFTHRKCCGCCDGCSVCIRPYNAFTPVVSGTLIADGCFPFSGGFGAGGACAPLCAVGETCASVTPETDSATAAAQYQYLMYQQQLAAQYMTQQQSVTAPQAMPYGPVQSAGYVPGYNYFGAGR